MELGHELGHFRESIILRGAKRIDPDEELEKKMSLKRYEGIGHESEKPPSKTKDKGKEKGKDKGKDKGKGKGKGKAGSSEEQREPGAVGGGATHNDVSANGEEEVRLLVKPCERSRWVILCPAVGVLPCTNPKLA